MSNRDLYLSDEQTLVFIDLWEDNPCLWDSRVKGARDRGYKLSAREDIAAAMGNGWTEAQVDRKIKSLRGHYNTWKRYIKSLKDEKQEDGQPRKHIWVYYERLRDFLINVENDGDNSNLTKPSTSYSHPADAPDTDTEQETKPNDLRILYNRTSNQNHRTARSPSANSASGSDLDSPPPPSYHSEQKRPYKKRRYSDQKNFHPAKRAAYYQTEASSPLTEAVLQLSASIAAKVSCKPSEHATFGNYVAERLQQFKSKQTVYQLMKDINKILDEALLEEVAD